MKEISRPPVRRVSRRTLPTAITVAVLFGLSFTIFRYTQKLPITDSYYSLLLSESLLAHHTPALNGYVIPHYKPFELPGILASGYAYQLVVRGGKLLNMCPARGPILSIPLVAVLDQLGFSVVVNNRFDADGDVRAERIIAAFLMATLTPIFFLTARLLLSYKPSLAIALSAAFGTQVWSTGAQALWSFDWQIVLFAIVAYLLLRAAVVDREPPPLVVATLIAWSYFIRPTSAVAVACVAGYVLICYRRISLRFALTGALWMGAFVAYWYRSFGQVVPDYYAPRRLSHTNFGIALFNNLFGASRGLFIYVPILFGVAYLLIRYWNNIHHKPLARLASSVCTAGLITVSMHGHGWWGGWSYGPRLTTELILWAVLLAILGIDAMRLAASARPAAAPSRIEMAAGAVLIALSVAINARGACCIATYDWNGWKDCHAPWSRQRFGDLIADFR